MIEKSLQGSGTTSDAACGCCEGTRPITPEPTGNRPGLPALTYRIGTQATFLETMKARLSSWCLGSDEDCRSGRGRYPLQGLRTRDSSDFSIALLDAWATVADVLTFYQERIANEGYLRTATERRSVLELARLVGYRLKPGVAASVFLAYTIDENTKEEVVVPRGSRSQSVPGPGELPQSFETSEDLEARAAWNNLKPRQTLPQAFAAITGGSPMRLYLEGTSTGLKVNDSLLIDPGTDQPEPFRIIAVDPEPEANRTRVTIERWIENLPGTNALFAAVRELVRQAPRGTTADRVVGHLFTVSERAGKAISLTEVVRALRRETLPMLTTARREAEAISATKLAPWLRKAETTFEALCPQLEKLSAAKPPSTAVGQGDPIAAQLALLTKPRSQPRQSSLRLPMDLKKNFSPTSDAGLKVLGTVREELRTSLPTVLATYALATPPSTLKVYALRQKAGLYGHNFPKRQRVVKESETATKTEVIGEWPIVLETETDPEGENEPRVSKATELADTIFLDASYDTILPDTWVMLDFSGVTNYVTAGLTNQVAPKPFADAVVNPADRLVMVTKARSVQAKVSRAEYGSSGDTTKIALGADWIRLQAVTLQSGETDQQVDDRDFEVVRGTAVFLQSEELRLAEAPIEEPVCGGADPDKLIELNGLYSDLEPGRFVIVSGERADIPLTRGVLASEAVMIAEVLHDVRNEAAAVPHADTQDSALAGDLKHTFIRLDRGLAYCYTRSTVVIYGNVVKATHGETRNEVLGSGDAARSFQTFTLKQPPLTYLAAPTPAGVESTLQVYVNNVRWHEAEDFTVVGPDAHSFITKTDDESRTSVVFGDGEHGARVPTGLENVRSIYRNGIGKPGNVRPGQISLLATRPLGVKDVINPLRGSGGADREGRDQARRNAPTAVKALDRLVSVRDYQDFARTFAGVGKARAAELTDGRRSVLHVTIAGADDIPIDEESDLFLNLRQALIDYGDPVQPVVLAVRDLLLLVVSAGIRLMPDYLWEPVVTAVRAALYDAFGFERRELGQDVVRSEVISLIQRVPGVAFVDLDVLGAVSEFIEDASAPGGRRLRTLEEIAAAVAAIAGAPPVNRIPVEVAVLQASAIRPAQLALLAAEAPETLVLNQLS